MINWGLVLGGTEKRITYHVPGITQEFLDMSSIGNHDQLEKWNVEVLKNALPGSPGITNEYGCVFNG